MTLSFEWLPVNNVTQQYIEKQMKDDDFQELSDDSITDLVIQQPDNSDDEGDGDSCDQQKISHSDALETALMYVEQQEDMLPVDKLMLRQLISNTVKMGGTIVKQKTLKAFLNM